MFIYSISSTLIQRMILTAYKICKLQDQIYQISIASHENKQKKLGCPKNPRKHIIHIALIQ